MRERRFGSFERYFQLPEGVDANKIEAPCIGAQARHPFRRPRSCGRSHFARCGNGYAQRSTAGRYRQRDPRHRRARGGSGGRNDSR
ncbi:Hsp20/alpha crystallin family protein [Cupriavidus pinatubonensis]|uniref:Hsp20/alpha crystallin family protein n=1 Tax=Cupriavidus pinatubonensis TaxID=248026 RepID=UPI001CC54255